MIAGDGGVEAIVRSGRLGPGHDRIAHTRIVIDRDICRSTGDGRKLVIDHNDIECMYSDITADIRRCDGNRGRPHRECATRGMS